MTMMSLFVFLALFLGIPTLIFLIGELLMIRSGLSSFRPSGTDSSRFDIL